MLNLKNPKASIFIPDKVDIQTALKRTTHIAIAAHQDDIEIMAYHGIAECYKKKDKWFLGIVVTDGATVPSREGKYSKVTNEQMAEIRKKEQNKAASLGKYSAVIQLSYSSAETKNNKDTDVAADICEILKQTNPEIIYTHNLADKHDTHVATVIKTITALRTLYKNKWAIPSKIFACEVWRSLDWLNDSDKAVLSTSAHKSLAKKLIAVFKSQIAGGKRYDLATIGRRLSNATYADSHASDKLSSATYSMDIKPLIVDDKLNPQDFISEYINKFKNDVCNRITKNL